MIIILTKCIIYELTYLRFTAVHFLWLRESALKSRIISLFLNRFLSETHRLNLEMTGDTPLDKKKCTAVTTSIFRII